MPRAGWNRVSRADPCPICGKPDNCCTSKDGRFAWCGRVHEDSLRENRGGQYLHRLDSGEERNDAWTAPPLLGPPMPTDESLEEDVEETVRAGRTKLPELASELRVGTKALERLRVGWIERTACWTFPERDAIGNVVGIMARTSDGAKRRVRGSRAGLTYADDWPEGDGPVLLVEGASDVAACLTMGLAAVGRPSNTGGVDLLAELLTAVPRDREILVVGENDDKPDGRWPGREGAILVAERLADRLGRPVGWTLPPPGTKDVREWLTETTVNAAER